MENKWSDSSGKRHFFSIFLSKFVLEVLGGGGAIWGSSDIWGLRKKDTVFFWRCVATVVACLFAVRVLLQINDFTLTNKTKVGNPSILRLLQIYTAKFVLEVCGAAGAIWGFSECINLRNPQTQEFWRLNSLIIETIFFCRFLMQITDSIKEINGYEPSTNHVHPTTRLCQVGSAKLVLDVFGGAGAIWGFSEIMTWRNSETQEIWRCTALLVGSLMFIRYVLQLTDFFLSQVAVEKYVFVKDMGSQDTDECSSLGLLDYEKPGYGSSDSSQLEQVLSDEDVETSC